MSLRPTAERAGLQGENRKTSKGFRNAGERVVRIRSDYEQTIGALLE